MSGYGVGLELVKQARSTANEPRQVDLQTSREQTSRAQHPKHETDGEDLDRHGVLPLHRHVARLLLHLRSLSDGPFPQESRQNPCRAAGQLSGVRVPAPTRRKLTGTGPELSATLDPPSVHRRPFPWLLPSLRTVAMLVNSSTFSAIAMALSSTILSVPLVVLISVSTSGPGGC